MRLSGAQLASVQGLVLWTAAEDEVIRSRYVAEGALALAAALPGRGFAAICRRAQKLGVVRKKKWTAADNHRLSLLWGEKSLAEIAAEMGRPVKGLYKHAQDIGLPLGCPQGYEYLTDAAERTGFAGETLRMILRWARVDLRLAMARPSGPRCRPTHVVSPDDVDDAIEAWLKTETLAAGAARHGVVPETLERWLLASGLELPRKPSGKKRWRIPTETIDSAVTMRSGRETIRAAAARTGVPRVTLRAWAVRAGIPRPTGKLWLVDPGTIDRLVQTRRAA